MTHLAASSAAVKDALLSIRSSAPAARSIFTMSFLLVLRHGVKLFGRLILNIDIISSSQTPSRYLTHAKRSLVSFFSDPPPQAQCKTLSSARFTRTALEPNFFSSDSKNRFKKP